MEHDPYSVNELDLPRFPAEALPTTKEGRICRSQCSEVEPVLKVFSASQVADFFVRNLGEWEVNEITIISMAHIVLLAVSIRKG